MSRKPGVYSAPGALVHTQVQVARGQFAPGSSVIRTWVLYTDTSTQASDLVLEAAYFSLLPLFHDTV
jgi:hypothetical protein